MKNNLLVVAVYAMLVCMVYSCGTTYREVVSTEDGSVITISRLRLRNTGNNCKKKTVIVQKDNAKKTVLSVEKKRFNCRGAYEYETHCKRWERREGKLVRIL
jgi:hypothetical protein